MSENLAESVSSRLAKHNQAKLLNEQNLSNEIESRLDDAFAVFNNDLSNIIEQLKGLPETLSVTLVNQAQLMADEHIKTANQHLTASATQLAQMQPNLENLIKQVPEAEKQLESCLADLKQTLVDAKTQNESSLADYAQHLQQQAQASMRQSEQQYQAFYQALSKRQADLRAKALMVGLVTFFLAMLPTAGMLGLAYYSRHLMNNQQQALAQVEQAVTLEAQNLATITSKIQQTPIEARALSMVTVLPNDQNPSQILIIPHNQQMGGYGKNPKGQKVLLVVPEAVMPNKKQ